MMDFEKFSDFFQFLCEVRMVKLTVSNNGEVVKVAQRNARALSKESVDIDKHGQGRR